MKYYINSKPATETEASKQIEENNRILNITDNEQFLKEATKLAFIIAIGERNNENGKVF